MGKWGSPLASWRYRRKGKEEKGSRQTDSGGGLRYVMGECQLGRKGRRGKGDKSRKKGVSTQEERVDHETEQK